MTFRWRKSDRPPAAFARWCDENAPVREHGWEDLATEAKDALRERLRADQHGLCAYCYGPLPDRDTRIEHIAPQAPDTTFDWANLALCCPGTSGTYRHCDRTKADRPLAVLHPWRAPVHRHVRLRSTGQLQVPDGDAAVDGDVRDVLRLDVRPLRERRRRALEALLDDRYGAAHLRHELDRLEREPPAEFHPLLADWLARRLARP